MTETAPGTPRPDYSRLFRLDGRTAVVVGGGSGIGREGALALAATGIVFAAFTTTAGSFTGVFTLTAVLAVAASCVAPRVTTRP